MENRGGFHVKLPLEPALRMSRDASSRIRLEMNSREMRDKTKDQKAQGSPKALSVSHKAQLWGSQLCPHPSVKLTPLFHLLFPFLFQPLSPEQPPQLFHKDKALDSPQALANLRQNPRICSICASEATQRTPPAPRGLCHLQAAVGGEEP